MKAGTLLLLCICGLCAQSHASIDDLRHAKERLLAHSQETDGMTSARGTSRHVTAAGGTHMGKLRQKVEMLQELDDEVEQEERETMSIEKELQLVGSEVVDRTVVRSDVDADLLSRIHDHMSESRIACDEFDLSELNGSGLPSVECLHQRIHALQHPAGGCKPNSTQFIYTNLKLMRSAGFGSTWHSIVWAAAAGLQRGYTILIMTRDWIWLDEFMCDPPQKKWECMYAPHTSCNLFEKELNQNEGQVLAEHSNVHETRSDNKLRGLAKFTRHDLPDLSWLHGASTEDSERLVTSLWFRGAILMYYFRLRPEVELSFDKLFDEIVPCRGVLGVHIRRGDRKKKLQTTIETYLHQVKDLLVQEETLGHVPAESICTIMVVSDEEQVLVEFRWKFLNMYCDHHHDELHELPLCVTASQLVTGDSGKAQLQRMQLASYQVELNTAEQMSIIARHPLLLEDHIVSPNVLRPGGFAVGQVIKGEPDARHSVTWSIVTDLQMMIRCNFFVGSQSNVSRMAAEWLVAKFSATRPPKHIIRFVDPVFHKFINAIHHDDSREYFNVYVSDSEEDAAIRHFERPSGKKAHAPLI